MAKSTPWAWAVVLGLVLLNLALWDRACGLSDKYKLARDDYNELRAATDADHALAVGHIAELNNAIGQANEAIAQKDAKIAQYVEKNMTLTAELIALQNAEPVQPELESQPLVISLRNQVSKLTEMYSLSQQTITLQSEEIGVLRGKCNALESIGTEWKQQYDKEHALRLSSEKLVVSLEKRLKASNTWSTVKTVAIGAAAIVAASAFIKK